MEYNGLTLDPFQERACNHIVDGHSVVVSAATGTGKTLVAEFSITHYTFRGLRSVYTSPIKALSNQKYRDFCRQYGSESVGILTGDVSINPGAQILVMTTEVYRNMALSDPESIADVGLLILDEVHFMNDEERGTVWEESIIFSPDSVRFLALSATIPNAREFAEWIAFVHDHEVKVVEHMERAVPLEHLFFPNTGGLHEYRDIMNFQPASKRLKGLTYRKKGRGGRRGGKKAPRTSPPPDHRDLMDIIEDEGLTPCIFFSFSRRDCEEKAMETAEMFEPLGEDARARLDALADRFLADDDIYHMPSVQDVLYVLERGVGFHHAGMLPPAKRIVEEAFEMNLVDFLFATETFAVGINFPARAVAFNSLRKFDGRRFRYLNSKEYYQMAGRAGRRGMDDRGTAIAMVDTERDDLRVIRRFTKGDNIPIRSQFSLSYNTTLNLLDKHTRREINRILTLSFDSFLKRKRRVRDDIKRDFDEQVKVLRSLGHVKGDSLTEKGCFTTKIYTQELITAELFFEVDHRGLEPVDLGCLAAGIVFEERRGVRFKRTRKQNRFHRLINHLRSNRFLRENYNFSGLKLIIPTVDSWMRGSSFLELMTLSNLQEGDLIRLFRQAIDVLQQVSRATSDPLLRSKIEVAVRRLDREAVSVEFE